MNHILLTALVSALLAGAAPVLAAGPAPTDSFTAADANGDGAIDLSEYHADIVRSWHRLDHDGDGHITEAEVLGVPHPMVNKALWRRMLRQADVDHDGRISFKELVYARMDFFGKADVDRDERLTPDEAAAFDRRNRAGSKRAAGPGKNRTPSP